MDSLLMSAYAIIIIVVIIAVGYALSGDAEAKARKQAEHDQQVGLTDADQQWLDDLIASRFGEEGQLL